MQPTKCSSQYSQLNLEENPRNHDVKDMLVEWKKSPSLRWKIFHGTHTMLGGIFLIAGSCMYFAEIVRRYSLALTAGGWFFTLGSFFLLLADLQEWWYNRHGCCSSQKSRDIYELSVDNVFEDSSSSILRRSEGINGGLNSFTAACGSAFYVIGSMLLIPFFEQYATIGNWLIIAGSILIFLCSLWKICLTGYINISDSSDQRFHLENIFKDLSELSINIFVGLGGVFYFLGIIYILSGFSMDDYGMNLSATFCVIGGSSFFLAGIFLQFRYYYRE